MGLALISIVFVIGVGNIQYTHYKLSVLYYSVQLPGASLASVEVLLTGFKNWLQTENRRKHTAVFIELLLQLKIQIINVSLFTFWD